MMRKFSFAVLILSFFISFPTFAAASAIRDYPMGCLSTTSLSAGTVSYVDHTLKLINILPANRRTLETICHQLLINDKALHTPPKSAEMFNSTVHDQTTDLGSCTVFAITAALESLLEGRNLSRAELYLRVKTKGKSSLSYEGCHLREYIPLLEEGILAWENFLPYESLVACLNCRKEAGLRLIYSTDYRETIEDFKNWCGRSARFIPDDFHPRWSEETYPVRVSDDLPGVVRFLWWFNPVATIARTVFDDHQSALQHIETRTRHRIEPIPYLPERFKMVDINIREIGLNAIKGIISQRIPIVVSMEVFKEPHMSYNLWSELFFPGRDLIDLPTETAKSLPNTHAVCICGYNNEISTKSGKGAFRLKNSWGSDWGDAGFAWISYEYFWHYTNSAYAICIRK